MNLLKEYGPTVAVTLGLVYILRSVVMITTGAGNSNGY